MTTDLPMTVLKVNHHSPGHIAERYPYAAYGSNLMMRQMQERCPKVELITAGKLLDYRLDFAKVATITLDKSSTTPVGIYKLTARDIERLDAKEGMGRTYDRYLITVIADDSRAIRCFTYIKKDGSLKPPTDEYFGRLLAGYRDWRFEDRRLRHARQRAVDAWETGEPARLAAQKMIDKLKSAGTAYAQGEMFERYEPLGNVVPMSPKPDVLMSHDDVEWGYREGQHYFRRKGQRAWYLDVSMPEDIGRRVVRGTLATNLPGAQAYKPWKGRKS